MKAQLMKIRCLTNLHMGSGDIQFGIVDGQVEKDPVTAYPVIFSSGVKGALREYAELHLEASEVEDIFGSERASNKEKRGKAGSVRVLTAQMIAMPMRASAGKSSYYMVTTKQMLMQFCRMQHDIENMAEGLLEDIVKLDNEKNYYLKSEEDEDIGVEGYIAKTKIPGELKKLIRFFSDTFSENVIVLSQKNMKDISLPIVARNHLENGKSVNLWYEEIVPHESLFFLYMLSNGTPSGDRSLERLLKLIDDNPLIQFGGNMTIGNGLTRVERWKSHE